MASNDAHPSCASRLRSLKALASGIYSDLTIHCQTKTFKVHKVKICLECDFFENATKSSAWNERECNVVEMHGDDPEVLEMLLQYLYAGWYAPGAVQHVSSGKSLKWNDDRAFILDLDVEAHYTVEVYKLLILHARVYALADKYGLPELKKIAAQRFGSLLSERGMSGDLAGDWVINVPCVWTQIVEIVYTSTASSDRTLRDFVVQEGIKFIDLLENLLVSGQYGSSHDDEDVLFWREDKKNWVEALETVHGYEADCIRLAEQQQGDWRNGGRGFPTEADSDSDEDVGEQGLGKGADMEAA